VGAETLLGDTDWATIASFATALGTLVLAVATFSAVRSSNRSARIAEAAFQVNLRPVLVTSRIDDPMQKIRWVDDHWVRLEGSQASVELVDGSIYLAISVRNVGPGLGVIFGWSVFTELALTDVPHRAPEEFRMQTRDLYIAPGDVGFWQAAIRGADDPDYPELSRDIREGEAFTIDVLYGDHQGGQRTVTRFGLTAIHTADDGPRWFPSVARHWNLDRPDPR
jgi:hypothetical protein